MNTSAYNDLLMLVDRDLPAVLADAKAAHAGPHRGLETEAAIGCIEQAIGWLRLASGVRSDDTNGIAGVLERAQYATRQQAVYERAGERIAEDTLEVH